MAPEKRVAHALAGVYFERAGAWLNLGELDRATKDFYAALSYASYAE